VLSDDYDEIEALIQLNTLAIAIHPQTMAYLDQLASTGLYGSDRVTTALSLIDEGVRNAIKNGFIKVEP